MKAILATLFTALFSLTAFAADAPKADAKKDAPKAEAKKEEKKDAKK